MMHNKNIIYTFSMLHLCNTATLKHLREGFVAISNPKKASVMN